MAWPHPVICVSTIFSYRRRRSANKAYIFINVINEQIIFISTKKSFNNYIIFSIFICLFFKPATDFPYFSSSFSCTHCVTQERNNTIGYISHSYHERSCQGIISKLISFFHCPEAVSQIIVFNRTVLLDDIKTTMVIGKHKPLVRYYLCGTKIPIWFALC